MVLKRPRSYRPPGAPKRSEQQRQYDTRRGSSAQRGYGYKWQKARDAYLAKHPLCVECDELGRTRPARHVDHKVPHNGDPELFWDEDNWQGLCDTHHAQKTRREQHAARTAPPPTNQGGK